LSERNTEDADVEERAEAGTENKNGNSDEKG
jgi:hypothetical protein